ncbi:hypothetical protein BH23GEM11_BH23GEM11_14150 [soil metagenome]
MPDLLITRNGVSAPRRRFLDEFRSMDLERALRRMDSHELEAIRGALRFLLHDVIPFSRVAGLADGAPLEHEPLDQEIEALGRELLAWFAAPGAPEAVRDARHRSVVRSVHRIEAMLEVLGGAWKDQGAN